MAYRPDLDRAVETATITGSGAYTLAGAVAGYQSLSGAGMANGDTAYLHVEAIDAASGLPNGSWELGLYTWNTGATLTRTTIKKGSNGTSAVVWPASTVVRIVATVSSYNTRVAGSDTYVQFNDGSAAGGDSGLTFDKTLKNLGVTGSLVMPQAADSTGTAGSGIYFDALGASHLALIGFNNSIYFRVSSLVAMMLMDSFNGPGEALLLQLHGSKGVLAYSHGNPPDGTPDAGVSSSASHRLEVNQGTPVANSGSYGDLALRGLQFASTLTVGTLPTASASEGLIYRVSDSSGPTVGSTVASGGSTKCSVQSNGAAWKVVWIA